MFITPIFTSKSNAYSVLDFPLSKSVTLKKAPVYSADKTELLSVPADYIGVLSLLDTCTKISDDAFDYYEFVDNEAYSGITDLIFSSSVSDISGTVLEHLNSMFGEDEKIHVAKGNKTFTVLGGKDGSSIERAVVKEGYISIATNTVYWNTCDGVVYNWPSMGSSISYSVGPVFIDAGSYTLTPTINMGTSSTTSSVTIRGTDSTGAVVDLSITGNSSNNYARTFTVPSDGAFLWVTITAPNSAVGSNLISGKTFKELFTVTKN